MVPLAVVEHTVFPVLAGADLLFPGLVIVKPCSTYLHPFPSSKSESESIVFHLLHILEICLHDQDSAWGKVDKLMLVVDIASLLISLLGQAQDSKSGVAELSEIVSFPSLASSSFISYVLTTSVTNSDNAFTPRHRKYPETQ